MNRREFLRRAAIAGVASAVGAGGYAWRIEPHWVQSSSVTCPSPRSPWLSMARV
jgi:hypothetical protein